MARVESNFAVEPFLAEPDRTRSAVTPMVADRERLLFAALVLVHQEAA